MKTILIIGSLGKCGGSTNINKLAEMLKADIIYSGGFMRIEAIRVGCVRDDYIPPANVEDWDLEMADLPEFRVVCIHKERDIDYEIDMFIMRKILAHLEGSEEYLLVDSKIASRLLHSDACKRFFAEILGIDDQQKLESIRQKVLAITKSVWLHANIRTRARRSLAKRGEVVLAGNFPGAAEDLLQHECASLQNRAKLDGISYRTKYLITDYPIGKHPPPSGGPYGVVIETPDSKQVDDTFAEVKEAFGL